MKETSVINRFSEVLSDVTEIKKSYLNMDWAQTLLLYEENRIEYIKEEDENVNTTYTSTSDHDTIDESIEKISQEVVEAIQYSRDVQLKKDVKIKLVISEIAHTSFRKNIRTLVSPIVTNIGMAGPFGLFHSALQIGPWLVEWNASAICIPRKCMSRAALLSLDVEAISSSDRVTEVIDNLADFIVEWNTTMEYAERPKDHKVQGNCQDFVDALLKKLGISTKFDGCVGEFMSKLRVQGKSDLEFVMDAKFREKFARKEKSVIFKTHLELDTFVLDLMKIEPAFGKTSYKKEYILLKSFDRAFWLRYFKFPGNETFGYYKIQEEVCDSDDHRKDCGCPFSDPEKTSSVVMM